jgi:hypothetical protein
MIIVGLPRRFKARVPLLGPVAKAEKSFGGLCEFCSYEGPFDRDEEKGEFVCPQCRRPPRDAPEDEWLG